MTRLHPHLPGLLVCAVTVITCLPLAAAAEPVASEPYEWKSVAIGGGGAIPNLVLHPKVKDLAYMCPDVSGPYRWDEGARRWVALTDFFRTFERNRTDALAVDPNDETGNTLYLATGSFAWPAHGPAELMKSTDRGQTWQRKKARIWGWSNGTHLHTQRLMVDPANSSVVYYAGREGLLMSTDAGET